MKTYQIQLLEPNAESLLRELVKLKLISFQELSTPKQQFAQLLSELRQDEGNLLDLEDITKEVEIIRSKNYKKSNES
jgi:hypothetical protein